MRLALLAPKWAVQAGLLLGSAGSGKTFRCLTEARRALSASPEGAPLVWVAPKQTTYQLERQLLGDPSLPGYSRLHILSFERLAESVFNWLARPLPKMLDEEGRLMVLRGLLASQREQLKLFRASARLTGFARQLSLLLRELQRGQLTPESLLELSRKAPASEALGSKLQDLAILLREYVAWLNAHGLQDADRLLAAATQALAANPPSSLIQHLWVDGFAEWSPQELDLLASVMPFCEGATLTFCLDRIEGEKTSWLSNWSIVRRTFEQCKARLQALPGTDVPVEMLSRRPAQNRFLRSPALRHLEQFWGESVPRPFPRADDSAADPLAKSIRVAMCVSPEAEATVAAREILRHVRAGGRYRDIAVLVRKLEGYYAPLQRIFSRYEIPFFLDRREPVSHHPLAELTRSALRTVAFQWRADDWFAALKTGLAPAAEEEIDRLENEALARGWKGPIWQKPILISDDPDLSEWLANLQRRLVPPFQSLALAMAARQNKPTGPLLAGALREFWSALNVEQKLRDWAAAEASSAELAIPSSVHATVWEQMNAWLENVELAFPAEALPLREWLPILEAGLANLTVGVIPPALDQVLIGPIDRSRNPDIKLALVLGMNETVFPARPEPAVLLTDGERAELEKQNALLGANARQHLSREGYYAYLAFTRARETLVLTSAMLDADGSPLNPSPFLARVRQLFPELEFPTVTHSSDWRESEHAHELMVPLLKAHGTGLALERFPMLASVMDQLGRFQNPQPEESIAPELAERLYGPVLRSSVSRLEQFAACPFKFFVHSGLRAEERKRFELDNKEQGTFQHDVLALFHEDLRKEGKRWRDITPREARERVAKVAGGLLASYREGLLQASERSRFLVRMLTESLQDFVETQVASMRRQYEFDPVQVEAPFGVDEHSPAWEIEVANGHRLAIQGRIDRIDLCRQPEGDAALCVVVDYKSSHRQLDPVLIAHGLQLQLLTYLNVLRRWPSPRDTFGVSRLLPVGVFYVSLRGKYEREPNRLAALSETERARSLAYRHTGRFDAGALRQLDSRPDAQGGDQFNYRLNHAGEIHQGCREALTTAEFVAMLDSVEAHLTEMGDQIFSGVAKVDPYRKGATTACDQCDYRAICRIDPWTHRFRVLRKEDSAD